MTLAEIKNKKLTCVVHTKSKTEAMILTKYMPQKNWRKNPLDYWDEYSEETGYYIEDGQLLQYSPVSFYKDRYPQFGEIYELSDLFATGGTISIHDLDTTSWYRPMNIDVQPLNLVCNEEKAKEIAERLNEELARRFNAFSNDGISAKSGGKNSMKFTFYTEEGYRIDKSNNSKVETITTFVKINGFDNTYLGMATCDKTDYSEREGVINALANAMCNGNFDREFNKAVKDNARADKKARTCTYCGQLFDTVAEKETHEAWHVERRKARHERYLLRKRAKEIAFEEQAQKMAKEIIAEDNKK